METKPTTKDALSILFNFLKFYNISTHSVHLTIENGKVSAASGTLNYPMPARQCKLLQKEYVKHVQRKDYRFMDTEIEFSDKAFKLVVHEKAVVH